MISEADRTDGHNADSAGNYTHDKPAKVQFIDRPDEILLGIFKIARAYGTSSIHVPALV